MSLRGDAHGDARLHFWEMCCAATEATYSNELGPTFPTLASEKEVAAARSMYAAGVAQYCAAIADAKLAEWDKRWGRNGEAP